jgi:hypothetical protein
MEYKAMLGVAKYKAMLGVAKYSYIYSLHILAKLIDDTVNNNNPVNNTRRNYVHIYLLLQHVLVMYVYLSYLYMYLLYLYMYLLYLTCICYNLYVFVVF